MGRPKGSKNKTKAVIEPFNPSKLDEEVKAVMGVAVPNGALQINDPISAASMSRAPMCASAREEVPFPDEWEKMGKIEKLKWLTANKR